MSRSHVLANSISCVWSTYLQNGQQPSSVYTPWCLDSNWLDTFTLPRLLESTTTTCMSQWGDSTCKEWDTAQFDKGLTLTMHTMADSVKCLYRGLMSVLVLNPDPYTHKTITNHGWGIVGCRIYINVLWTRGELISQLYTRELGRLVNTLWHLSLDLTDGE